MEEGKLAMDFRLRLAENVARESMVAPKSGE